MSNIEIFKCPECRLHYANEDVMKRCWNYCKQYHACSLEITKHSEEAKANK